MAVIFNQVIAGIKPRVSPQEFDAFNYFATLLHYNIYSSRQYSIAIKLVSPNYGTNSCVYVYA